jgi:adenine/guanine/hypoxanthine permease
MQQISSLEKKIRLGNLNVSRAHIKREVLAGIATFITMSYSIFAAPLLLGAAGMAKGAVITAVCLCSALGCFAMGLWANLPAACGISVSIMLFFATELTQQKHLTWEQGLGLAAIANGIFVVLSHLNLREWLARSIPTDLKHAITGGIALLISIVALKLSNAFQLNATHLNQLIVAFPFTGFCLSLMIMTLLARRIPHIAFLIMIIIATMTTHMLSHQWPTHLIEIPASIEPNLLHLSLPHLSQWQAGLSVICAFLIINLLDCSATIYGLSDMAGLIQDKDISKRMNRAMMSAGGSGIIASFIGCSPVNIYFESASGIQAGGRTGLTSITIAIMFLVALMLSPIIHMVPHFAIAAGLFHTTLSVSREKIQAINWQHHANVWPCMLTLLIIPFSHSIPYGIGIGILSYHWLTRDHSISTQQKRTRQTLNIFFLLYFLISI